MPRYYFDIRRDGVTERDPDGLYLASATDARAEATTAAEAGVSASAASTPSDVPIFFISFPVVGICEVRTAGAPS